MNDESEPVDGVSDAGDSSEGTFFQKLREQEDQRREIADAFVRESSSPPRLSDLVEMQERSARQMAELNVMVGRLKRSLSTAFLLLGLIVIAMIGLGGIVYWRPDLIGDYVAAGRVSETAPQMTSDQSSRIQPELVLEPDTEFLIRNDIDRKYQLMIRELYNNVRMIRQPAGSLDERSAANEDYITLMTRLTPIIEQAAAEGASEPIIRALTNLASIATDRRKITRSMDLSIETQNKMDQVGEVLRARDVRSSMMADEGYP